MKKLIVLFAMVLMGQIAKGQDNNLLYKMEIMDVHNVMFKSAMEYPYIYDLSHPTMIKKVVGKDTTSFRILDLCNYFIVPFYVSLNKQLEQKIDFPIYKHDVKNRPIYLQDNYAFRLDVSYLGDKYKCDGAWFVNAGFEFRGKYLCKIEN